ncbi:MAG: FkbM family methyltransferase [Dysgonamonadaceae bacterium]|jgi:hypothetical protein|nr:FkbM family methyltransferase [Dysgonamonadaceae bacterium]
MKGKEDPKQKYIRNYFLALDKNQHDPEIMEIIKYFKKNLFNVFPYDFTTKYDPEEINVFADELCGMKYVMHTGKKMYFPEEWDAKRIRVYYNGLCVEQDTNSPHRYETPDYIVSEGDVIADIGAAEGFWALTYAEKAAKIYLFECNTQWRQALAKTFEPWQDKTVIVNKYVSNVTEGDNITIDDFINGDRINFIKADIEGMEIQMLEGAEKNLAVQPAIRLLLCTYHRKNDMAFIKEYLEKRNFIVEHSKRYMLFLPDKELTEPFLRRGVARATKIQDISATLLT